MDLGATLAVLVGFLIAGLASGMPVALVFVTINIFGLYFFFDGASGLSLLAGSAFNSTAQFALVPIPLFILMGELLVRSGLATATVEAADQWIGRIPGRLAVTTVAGGTIFGSLNGASMASVAMLGTLIAPEMARQHYKPPMVVGPILGAGGLAVLIPPSAMGVLLGALAKVSIAELLIASSVPGFILALAYTVYYVTLAWMRPHLAPPYAHTLSSLTAKLKTLRLVVPVGVLILVVTGFMFLGIATPSEAAAMGAVTAGIIAAIYGTLNWAILREATMSTVSTTAMILLILVGSSAYSQLLAATGATSWLIELVTELPLAPIVMVIALQVVVLIMGCFIDGISIMMLTVPIFYPIISVFGVDPIWFSVLMLIQLELGGITPPFGLLLFVLKGVRPELSVSDIYRATIPIVIMQCSVAGLIMLFPSITKVFTSAMLH